MFTPKSYQRGNTTSQGGIIHLHHRIKKPIFIEIHHSFQWYTDYDAQKPDWLDEYMTPDAVIYFANNAPLTKEGFRKVLHWQWNATEYNHAYVRFLHIRIMNPDLRL